MTVSAAAVLDGWVDASMRVPPQPARRFLELAEIRDDLEWSPYFTAYHAAYTKRTKELR